MDQFNVKSLIARKYSIFNMIKILKVQAVETEVNSVKWKKIQAELECYEKELATIDHDIELLDKYDK